MRLAIDVLRGIHLEHAILVPSLGLDLVPSAGRHLLGATDDGQAAAQIVPELHIPLPDGDGEEISIRIGILMGIKQDPIILGFVRFGWTDVVDLELNLQTDFVIQILEWFQFNEPIAIEAGNLDVMFRQLLFTKVPCSVSSAETREGPIMLFTSPSSMARILETKTIVS